MIDRGMRAFAGVYKQVFIAGAMVVMLVVAGLSGSTVESSELLNLQAVSTYRAGMASTANSGFSRDIDVSTVQGALSFLPVGMATLLLAPFPWQMVSLRPLIAAPETIAWWLLFPATLRGLVLTVRNRFHSASPLLLFSASLTIAYSLMQGNVGSAFRQRAQIFVFLFIFTAVGWYQRKCRKLQLDEKLLLIGDTEFEEETPYGASDRQHARPA
jgi:hypothetical protein